MDKDQAMKLAVGMCEQGGVKYQVRPDGEQIRTLIGSAAVYIEVSGEGRFMSYRFTAVFVEGLDIAALDELALYKWVNEQNRRRWYGRVYVVERDGGVAQLYLQEEILVANVQQDEFIHSLRAMWAHADELDDEAIERFGGRSAQEVISGSGTSSGGIEA